MTKKINKTDSNKKKEQERTTLNKKAMLQALEKSLNIVTTACKAVGITRETHYKWMNNDPEYHQAVLDLREVVKDFGESKLHKLMNENHPAAIIFFNKTQNRDRGYIERQEIDHGGSITIHTHEGDKDL